MLAFGALGIRNRELFQFILCNGRVMGVEGKGDEEYKLGFLSVASSLGGFAKILMTWAHMWIVTRY